MSQTIIIQDATNMLETGKDEKNPNIVRDKNFLQKHLGRKPSLEDGAPPFSAIEFSTVQSCNRRCVFCPRVDKTAFPNEIEKRISPEFMEKIAKELAQTDYEGKIELSGFGEPFLHREVFQLIRILKENVPRCFIELNTNGDLLNEARLRDCFAMGLDRVKVSFYDNPETHLQRLIDLGRAAGLTDDQYIIRGRHESASKEFGLPSISNRAGFIDLSKLGVTKQVTLPRELPCYYPFYKMVIDWNGDALMCSNDWKKELVLGNLHDQTIYEVWNGEIANAARRRLAKSDRSSNPCANCDIQGTLAGGEHFEAWNTYLESKK